MRKLRLCLAVCVLIGLATLVTSQTTQARSSGRPGDEPASARLGNCPIFPSDNEWNRDISHDPVDPNSANYIAGINKGSGNKNLRAGFGLWSYYGIPYNVVSANTPKVPVYFFQYADESDPGPYAIPANALVEQNAGDRHVIAIDQDNCLLYELYKAFPTSNGWLAGSGAIFDLRSNKLRPSGWTSADAAGLPIFPGLARIDEVQAGQINHALRFLVHKAGDKYVFPARHYSSTDKDPSLPPMGLRLRLKASFDTSKFTGQARVILEALKKYGMIVADEAHESWYISGMSSPLWNRDELETLRKVPGTAFEVVQPRNAPPETPIPPTKTPVPPTNTPAPTNPPTKTSVPTDTPQPSATAVTGTVPLKVQYRASFKSTDDATASVRIRIVNQGTENIPLSELTVRYYFTGEGESPFSFACDYVGAGCNYVSGTFTRLPVSAPGADRYLEIGFSDGARSLAPNHTTGEMALRINRQDWGSMDETNDYSFDASKRSLTDWDHITLYRNGALVWGIEPTGQTKPNRTPVPTFIPRVTATPIPTITAPTVNLQLLYKAGETKVKSTQVKPYFQLVNNGNAPVQLSQLTIRYYFAAKDKQPLAFACSNAAIGCGAITAQFSRTTNRRPNAQNYLEIGFSDDATTLAPGASTGDIQVRFNKADWSNFDQSQDYSFNANHTTFGPWQRVTLYLNGKLIAGIEP